MRELYRIACRDDAGTLHMIIVRRKRPFFWFLRKANTAERGVIQYVLSDGRPAKMLDEHRFELPDRLIVTREE